MKSNLIRRIIGPHPTIIALLAAVTLTLTSPANAEMELAGLDLAHSGSELIVAGEPVRLHGISFPVEDGICGSGQNECRSLALEFLDNWIDRPELVQCEILVTLSSGVHLTRCYYNGEELAARLVNSGRAVADRRATRRYMRDEHEARNAERGMWSRQVQLVASLTEPF